MAKQSTSQRIREMLEQGYPVKVISKKLKCSPSLVYQVRAYDKKKSTPKTKQWSSGVVTTSAKPTVKGLQKRQQEAVLGVLAAKPGSIRYGETVFVPKDYATAQPKRNVVQRFFNWLCGG